VTLKDLAFFVITLIVSAAWGAMLFVSAIEGVSFPAILHYAFVAVAAANGYTIVSAVQIAKLNAQANVLKQQVELERVKAK
jgi:hypothetical protein